MGARPRRSAPTSTRQDRVATAVAARGRVDSGQRPPWDGGRATRRNERCRPQRPARRRARLLLKAGRLPAAVRRRRRRAQGVAAAALGEERRQQPRPRCACAPGGGGGGTGERSPTPRPHKGRPLASHPPLPPPPGHAQQRGPACGDGDGGGEGGSGSGTSGEETPARGGHLPMSWGDFFL